MLPSLVALTLSTDGAAEDQMAEERRKRAMQEQRARRAEELERTRGKNYGPLAEKVMHKMLETFGSELRRTAGYHLLAGTNFDMEAPVREALAAYASTRNKKQFVDGLREQLPQLTEFEHEMVKNEVVVFDRYTDYEGMYNAFQVQGQKLFTLNKSKKWSFAFKALVWIFSYLPDKELAGTILDYVEQVTDGGTDRKPWHEVLARYQGVYNSIRLTVQEITDDTGIDISGMFGRTITLEYVVGNDSLERVSNAKSLKPPKGRDLTEDEKAIQQLAIEVDKEVDEKLAEVKRENPNADFQTLLKAQIEVESKKWTPFLERRRAMADELRNVIVFKDLPRRLLKFESPPTAEGEEAPEAL